MRAPRRRSELLDTIRFGSNSVPESITLPEIAIREYRRPVRASAENFESSLP